MKWINNIDSFLIVFEQTTNTSLIEVLDIEHLTLYYFNLINVGLADQLFAFAADF